MRQQHDTQPLLATRDRPAVHYTHGVDAERSHTTCPDTDFGGPENRARLEKVLLRKIDLRLSILVLIYILNCEWPVRCEPTPTELLKDIDRNNAAYAVFSSSQFPSNT